MKNNGRVQGNKEHAKPIVVFPDCVYLHKNIEPLDDGLYEYDEIVYDVEEYICIMQEQIISLQHALVAMHEERSGE